MLRALVLTLVVVVVTLVAAGSAGGIAYWAMALRFVAGNTHALDAIVRAPVNEPRNTEKLRRARVPLIFGTDIPFVLGNFFHSVMNEVRALKLAGLPNEAILRMATSDAANALGINDLVGTIEPGKLADLVLLDGDSVPTLRPWVASNSS
ncbi:MAG: hypothetical protein EXQ55_07505 [Acidobacteria bacterium]|nr:hypothetical protein [Acidobacteriota bacterium]